MQTIENFKQFIRVRRLISITGLLFYPAVLWVFRPNYYGSNTVVLIILGSLPHFLAGVLLPISALKPELILKYPHKFQSFFLGICLFVLAWLILEEFYPFFSPTAVTDPFDILFGILGVAVSLLLYHLYFKRLILE